MKQALLSFSLLLLFQIGFSQSSFSDRLSIKRTASTETIVDLRVFPNPATVYFSLNDNDSVQKIVVYNLVGKEMKNFQYEKDQKYSVEDLSKGIYLVQIRGKDDKIIATQRLSKR